jgi:hypothetical protein
VKDLFPALVSTSELSPLFAENALRRALHRAGVTAEHLSAADLATAQGEIERTIRTFLPDRVEQVLDRVRWLGRGPAPAP